VLRDDFPKRLGKQGVLEHEFAIGTGVECLIDPEHPDELFVPPAHDRGPLLLGLLPASALALVGLKMLLTAAPPADSE
jgi:hypothetical protein